MKTPHAILIGLSLIAAGIFFKDTAVKPAYAKVDGVAQYGGKTEGFDCLQAHNSKGKRGNINCYRLDDQGAVYQFQFRKSGTIITPKLNFWFKYE